MQIININYLIQPLFLGSTSLTYTMTCQSSIYVFNDVLTDSNCFLSYYTTTNYIISGFPKHVYHSNSTVEEIVSLNAGIDEERTDADSILQSFNNSSGFDDKITFPIPPELDSYFDHSAAVQDNRKQGPELNSFSLISTLTTPISGTNSKLSKSPKTILQSLMKVFNNYCSSTVTNKCSPSTCSQDIGTVASVSLKDSTPPTEEQNDDSLSMTSDFSDLFLDSTAGSLLDAESYLNKKYGYSKRDIDPSIIFTERDMDDFDEDKDKYDGNEAEIDNYMSESLSSTIPDNSCYPRLPPLLEESSEDGYSDNTLVNSYMTSQATSQSSVREEITTMASGDDDIDQYRRFVTRHSPVPVVRRSAPNTPNCDNQTRSRPCARSLSVDNIQINGGNGDVIQFSIPIHRKSVKDGLDHGPDLGKPPLPNIIRRISQSPKRSKKKSITNKIIVFPDPPTDSQLDVCECPPAIRGFEGKDNSFRLPTFPEDDVDSQTSVNESIESMFDLDERNTPSVCRNELFAFEHSISWEETKFNVATEPHSAWNNSHESHLSYHGKLYDADDVAILPHIETRHSIIVESDYTHNTDGGSKDENNDVYESNSLWTISEDSINSNSVMNCSNSQNFSLNGPFPRKRQTFQPSTDGLIENNYAKYRASISNNRIQKPNSVSLLLNNSNADSSIEIQFDDVKLRSILDISQGYQWINSRQHIPHEWNSKSSMEIRNKVPFYVSFTQSTLNYCDKSQRLIFPKILSELQANDSDMLKNYLMSTTYKKPLPPTDFSWSKADSLNFIQDISDEFPIPPPPPLPPPLYFMTNNFIEQTTDPEIAGHCFPDRFIDNIAPGITQSPKSNRKIPLHELMKQTCFVDELINRNSESMRNELGCDYLSNDEQTISSFNDGHLRSRTRSGNQIKSVQSAASNSDSLQNAKWHRNRYVSVRASSVCDNNQSALRKQQPNSPYRHTTDNYEQSLSKVIPMIIQHDGDSRPIKSSRLLVEEQSSGSLSGLRRGQNFYSNSLQDSSTLLSNSLSYDCSTTCNKINANNRSQKVKHSRGYSASTLTSCGKYVDNNDFYAQSLHDINIYYETQSQRIHPPSQISAHSGDRQKIDSPYKVQIRDPINTKNVICYGPVLNKDHCHRLDEPITFVVDASRAGEAPLEIVCTTVQGQQPVDVKPRGHSMPGIFDITLKPSNLGIHSFDIKYANNSVPGSPFKINVLPKCEPAKVKVYGEGVNPSTGNLIPMSPTQFRIDTLEAGNGEIQISLSNPNDMMLPVDIIEEGNGIFCCQYTPIDAGKHRVTVAYDEVPVPNSPFVVKVASVGDATKCFIEDGLKKYVVIDTEMMITINTAEAGDGRISCRILPISDNGEIRYDIPLSTEVEDNGNGTQSIYYTPTQLGNYLVDIKFGGINIDGGEYQMKSVDLNSMPEEEIIEMDKNNAKQYLEPSGYSDYTHGLYPVEFRLPINFSDSLIEAIVATPSGQHENAFIHDNGNGTVTIRYEPKERGMHEMIVTCNSLPIQGSPYRFFAENAGVGRVAAYGSGLSHGKTGTPCEFSIVTKDAGAGGLSLAIEGPSKAEIICKDNENGSCDVTYYPMVPGDYSVIIKFADKNIPGSPFVANIIGQLHQRSQICIGNTSDVPLKIQNLDISTLTASVKAPSGKEEPCILKKMINDNLGISFTPKEVGEHSINVYKSGSHITGSPFKIIVGQNEIGDATKVRVYGDGLKSGNSNDSNSFTVDTRDAGYGGLSLSIEGPSKAEIECRDNYDGTCQVSYIPNEPGTYMINIKYANEHVLGSPFAVKISGEPSTKLMEKIIRRQEAADITQVGSQCELTLKIPGTNHCDMRATVTNQNGVTEVCEIIDLDDGHYSIKFVPKEMGLHTVIVKHKNVDIPGSPFQFTVGPIVDGGSHKVVSSGAGLKSGRINEINEFSVYTREAGAGGLSIAVEGPSKAEIQFEDRKDGSCGVKYKVSEPGEYLATIKFNDDHIPNSPFRIIVTEQLIDYVSVASVGSSAFAKELLIGKPAAFTVSYQHATKALAKLKAFIKGPTGNEESAIIQSIEKNQYAIRFIPKESGEHLISVLDELTDKHIPGSPYRVVIGTQHADPSMVQARGNGLKSGICGKKGSFIVNTLKSGTGDLNVTVDGPSKVQLYSQEHDEGYEFFYIPSVAGEYNITIKYGGNYHIAGSPFNVVIKESDSSVALTEQQLQSRPDKVLCQGYGLMKASLNETNTFNVDASKAGNDILFVGIAGPKSQCEEVSVKRTGNNQFVIHYSVQEKGRHYLMVKWGDRHIPGSPFVVDVL